VEDSVQAFIELWRPKPAWRELPREQRQAYLAEVEAGAAALEGTGIELVGWGTIEPEPDPATASGFTWYAIWRATDAAEVQRFRDIVAESGWYGYFEQANVAGELRDPSAVLAEHVDV
jgi:hypothetical protein